MTQERRMLAECANFLESIRPEQEFVASEKPYPDSALHENTIEEIKTKLLEARKLQHLYPQFSEQEMAHLNFVDEATAVIQFKQLDELSKTTLGSYIRKSADSGMEAAHKSGAAAVSGNYDVQKKQSDKSFNRYKGILKATRKLTKEDAQQLDELSDKTLKSYAGKAKESAKELSDKAMEHAKNKDTYNMRKTTMKLSDRIKAARMAVSKMTESAFTEEELATLTQEEFEDLVENYTELNELSKNTLASYVKKAHDSATGLATTAMHHKNTADLHNQVGNRKKSNEFDRYSFDATDKQIKRTKGVHKAVGKLTKEDLDIVANIEAMFSKGTS